MRGKWVNLRVRNEGRNRSCLFGECCVWTAIFCFPWQWESPSVDGGKDRCWKRLSEMLLQSLCWTFILLCKKTPIKMSVLWNCWMQILTHLDFYPGETGRNFSFQSGHCSFVRVTCHLNFFFFRNIKIKFFWPVCTLYSNINALLEWQAGRTLSWDTALAAHKQSYLYRLWANCKKREKTKNILMGTSIFNKNRILIE